MRRSLIILLIGLIALTLLASFLFKSALWGLSAWGAISPLVALACAVVFTPQLFLKTAPDPFRRLPRMRSHIARSLVIAAVSIAALWLLRSRHELWGERSSLGAAIETGAYRPTAPLATFVQWICYRFTNGIFLTDADSVITFFSIAAGALYVLLAVRAAGLLCDEDDAAEAKRLAAAALLSGGFAALFFGCGGNVPIALVGEIAFLTEAMRFLRGRGGLVRCSVFLAVAILSHLSAAFLIPAFVYLLARGLRLPGARRGPIAAGAAFILILAAGGIIPALIARQYGTGHSSTLSLRFAFDWAAASNVLNSLLIIGPASVAAVLLLIVRAGRASAETPRGAAREELSFLTIGALSALAALAAGSDLIDGGLRWHVLATTGPALSIYVLWVLKRESTGTERFKKALWALFLVGVFQTIPLIIINAVPRAAERRLIDLSIAPGRAEMIVADVALQRGDLAKARTWYLSSLAKNASNEIAELRLGRIAMKREEYAEAITHFLNASELDPSSAHNRFELAEALISKRWFPEAVAQLETLTVAYPESVAFWRKLGFALNNGNRYEQAVGAYEKALALEPDNEENLRNLVSALLNRAAELQSAKKNREARALYERVIEMYPMEWRSYNNLAVIEMNEGRMQEAYDILDGALKLHPFESSLHFNMGIVLEKLGRDREALSHMVRARDLDPMYSKAPAHIERLARKLGIWNPARPDSQVNPSESP
jgi:tetratricopeptide (TPR) repeat protein